MSKIVAAAIESSGNLTLRAGGADRVTVGSDGQVGIGTASPSAPLHVSDLTAEVRITAPTITGADWGILPQIGNNTPVFRIFDRSNSSDRLTISSAGLVTIPGTLTVSGGATLSGAATLSSTLTVGTATMAVPTGNAPIFGARAWVVFDTNKTAAGNLEAALTASNRYIRRSGNIASVNRDGQGLFTITFTTPMPHADYVVIPTIAANYANLTQGVVLTTGDSSTSSGWANNTTLVLQPYYKTTTGFTIHTGSTQDGIRRDPYSNPISVLVFA